MYLLFTANPWHPRCSPSVRCTARGQVHAGNNLEQITFQAGGTVAKEDRGFASMDRTKQRDIASKGGKAAHQKGTAHEWTSEEAREAGRKGGMASHRRKQQGEGSAEGAAANQSDQSEEPIAGSDDAGSDNLG
jgi:uncharacterized protein